MKWTSLSILILIGFVAGDGAWKENEEYKYKLQARTFLPLPELNNEYVGVISRAHLTIRPQLNNTLICQISEAEYGEVDQHLTEIWNSDLSNRKLAYYQWPLEKPFKIHFDKGVISSLSVDSALSNYQMNQLKVIVSQFQVDTNAQNVMQNEYNHLPEGDSNNAFYKTMETIVTGNCETIYDISPIPDYVLQSHEDWVPLPELKRDGEFIQIVKTRNYSNCDERSDYLFDITGLRNSNRYPHQEVGNVLSLLENRRVTISGSLKNYTIQSSITTNKVIFSNNNDNPSLHDYVYVSLESVKSTERVDQNEIKVENLLNIGNLIYTYDSQNTAPQVRNSGLPRVSLTKDSDWPMRNTGSPVKSSDLLMGYTDSPLRDVDTPVKDADYTVRDADSTVRVADSTVRVADSTVRVADSTVRDTDSPTRIRYQALEYNDPEEHWSHCWTWFPAGSTICKGEFGPAYEDIGRKTCGFLGLGMMIHCRLSFPGCQATPCFSVFIHRSELCERTFGIQLPTTRGGFEDCSPGFYRSRCCPK